MSQSSSQSSILTQSALGFPSGLRLLPAVVLRNKGRVNLNAPERGPASGFDQYRFFAGFSGPLGRRIGTEVGYQMQHIDRRGGDALFHQAYLALSMRFD